MKIWFIESLQFYISVMSGNLNNSSKRNIFIGQPLTTFILWTYQWDQSRENPIGWVIKDQRQILHVYWTEMSHLFFLLARTRTKARTRSMANIPVSAAHVALTDFDTTVSGVDCCPVLSLPYWLPLTWILPDSFCVPKHY